MGVPVVSAPVAPLLLAVRPDRLVLASPPTSIRGDPVKPVNQIDRIRAAAKSHRCDVQSPRCDGFIHRGEQYTETAHDERMCQRCVPLERAT